MATCSDSGDCSTSSKFDFSTALLDHHLGSYEDGVDLGGEDQVDGGASVFDTIKNLRVTPQALKYALQLARRYKEDVNELHPPDDRDKLDLGHVAVLHQLVTRAYFHQTELVVALMTFSDAKIDLETSKGKTAFHLTVELGNIKVMKTLASLGANVTLPPIDRMPYMRPFLLQGKNRQPATSSTRHVREYIPTYTERELSGWATGYFGDSTIIGFDTRPLQYTTSSPQANTESMVTLLREIGSLPMARNSYSRPCTKYTSKDYAGANSGGASVDCVKYHPKKQNSQQTKAEPPTPSIKSPENSGGDLTPDQQVVGRKLRGVHVLCLDGGGVRGLLQLEILRQLEQRLDARKETITSFFDYIVGTSTGGIIALALVYGRRTIRQIQRLYLEMKKDVFTRRGLEAGDSRTLELWLRADENMREKKMNSVTHPKVLVSGVMRKTTDIQLDWFNNFLGNRKSKELVIDVARYTSAAPFYFTPKNCYIDGGLLANNPSLYAVTTIQNYLRREEHGRGVSLVVSVGAGRNPPRTYYNMEINNPVVRTVGFPMFMVHVVESHSVLSEACCQCMCKEQGIEYLRLNPSLAYEIGPAETNNRKLLDMLWTTRKYMHQSARDLDKLKKF